MDFENERVLKLIFPNGVPDDYQDNPEILEYLYKLGTLKVDQLKTEHRRLADDNKSVIEQTQDLAITNYRTFIKTSECSRSICNEFKVTETKLDGLIEKLPGFLAKCDTFISSSSEYYNARRLNTLTLKRNTQLLEILELPQLMDTCMREDRYEEALELAGYVQKLGQKHGKLPIIKNIVQSIESNWHTMLSQLLAQLKTDLQLPKCLQVVGYLRQMQAFSNTELKLKFLQARDSWLNNILAEIPQDDPQTHLTRTIELSRIHLFNIITQYKAIFTDDDTTLIAKDDMACDSSLIFSSWLHRRVEAFLKTLEYDLQRGVSSLDIVLGQCMYFGLSFGRVGTDFRGLMAPIFVKTVLQHFNTYIFKITKQLEADLDKFTLINKISTMNRLKNSIQTETHSPPETLLDYHPLAIYCNGLLTAFNELRLCAPFAVAAEVTKSVQISLEAAGRGVFTFYRREQQAFSGHERDNFVKLCSCFAFDLVPYIQRCLQSIFPPNSLATHIGITVANLQTIGIGYLNQKAIVEPVQNLLPDRIEKIITQVSEQKVEDKADEIPQSIEVN